MGLLVLCFAILIAYVYCEYTQTPFGLVHKDCIIEVPSGTQVGLKVIDGVEHAHVMHPNGSTKLHSRCPHAAPHAKRAAPNWAGWPQHYWYGLDFGYFTNPALSVPVTSFQATWNVPNYPVNRNGNSSAPWPNQPTLSWWTGLQPQPQTGSTFSNVIQPVLEFNGLIANSYDLSSWNCCPAGYTFHSTPIAISPGQTVNGTMDLVSPNDPYTFRITTQIVGGSSTSLTANMSSAAPRFTWSEIKNEGYFVTSCNQLPTTAATFKINKFATQSGSVDVHTIPWKQGYVCQDAACPSAALSPSCVGAVHQNQDSVTIQFS